MKDANLRDQEVACKRELSTLFAHMIFESGHYEIEFNNISLNPGASFHGFGLRFAREPECYYRADQEKPSCYYRDGLYTPSPTGRYYGQGPIMLRWLSRYG